MKGSEQEPTDIEDQPRKMVKKDAYHSKEDTRRNCSDKTLSTNIARKGGNT